MLCYTVFVIQSLRRLELDSSSALLRSVFASDAVLARLSGVSDLSARSSDLTRIRDDLPSFFSSRTLRLSSVRWHCDRRLIWLRDWLLRGETTHSEIADENR